MFVAAQARRCRARSRKWGGADCLAEADDDVHADIAEGGSHEDADSDCKGMTTVTTAVTEE
jgi:hypothetical protein